MSRQENGWKEKSMASDWRCITCWQPNLQANRTVRSHLRRCRAPVYPRSCCRPPLPVESLPRTCYSRSVDNRDPKTCRRRDCNRRCRMTRTADWTMLTSSPIFFCNWLGNTRRERWHLNRCSLLGRGTDWRSRSWFWCNKCRRWDWPNNSTLKDSVRRRTANPSTANRTRRISPTSCWPPVIHRVTNKSLFLGWFTLRKSSSNLYAPPPVAQTVVTRLAIPLDLARAKKFTISLDGNRMKCKVPFLPRMYTSSIYQRQNKSITMPTWALIGGNYALSRRTVIFRVRFLIRSHGRSKIQADWPWNTRSRRHRNVLCPANSDPSRVPANACPGVPSSRTQNSSSGIAGCCATSPLLNLLRLWWCPSARNKPICRDCPRCPCRTTASLQQRNIVNSYCAAKPNQFTYVDYGCCLLARRGHRRGGFVRQTKTIHLRLSRFFVPKW